MANKLKAQLIVDQIRELMIPVIAKKKELADYQEKCKHPRGTIEYCSNTGNWDPNDDSSWINVHCDICFKDLYHLDTKELDCRKFTCNKNFKRKTYL